MLVLKGLHAAVADWPAKTGRGEGILLTGCDDRNRHDGGVRAARRRKETEDIEIARGCNLRKSAGGRMRLEVQMRKYLGRSWLLAALAL